MTLPPPASPTAPQKTHRVAFLGFSDFERNALATYFRLSAERRPRYELVYTLTDADFLVADADHGPSVQLVVVTERLGEAVFIGSQAPEGAAGSMRRPIDALHVMRALDALVLPHGDVSEDHGADGVQPPPAEPAAAEPAAAPSPAPSRPPQVDGGVIVESMRRRTVDDGQAQPAAPAAPQAPHPRSPPGASATPRARTAAPKARSMLAHPLRPPPPRVLGLAPPPPQAPFVGPPAPARALLVDDSSVALTFLARRLAPWSLRTDAVHTSGEALEQLAERAYEFIFLDVELGPESELDGLALCRHIKRSELAMNATVVMVSAHQTEVDRARGSLAGCDAYLGKPLRDSELAAVLHRHGLVAPPAASRQASTKPSPA